MNLNMYQKDVFDNYKSNSQRARVLTENWFNTQMYCPHCLNKSITSYPNNKKAYDFLCERCNTDYQLKASSKRFTNRVLDGEFNTMMKVVTNNNAPNFFLLNYLPDDWFVKNLSVVPKLFINPTVIEKRKPLSLNARRAGWVGCNVLLKRIPDEGNIFVVKNGIVLEKEKVNKTWKKMTFLELKKSKTRGWTADVLRCVEDLSKEKFTIQDVYKFEGYLSELYPNNKHIRDKIRQQLQILRDNRILEFVSPGVYELK